MRQNIIVLSVKYPHETHRQNIEYFVVNYEYENLENYINDNNYDLNDYPIDNWDENIFVLLFEEFDCKTETKVSSTLKTFDFILKNLNLKNVKYIYNNFFELNDFPEDEQEHYIKLMKIFSNRGIDIYKNN